MIGIIISIISIIISIIVIVKVNKSCTGRACDEIQRYKEVEFQKEKEKYIKELDVKFNVEKEKYLNELVNVKKEIEQTKQFNSTLLSMREREIDGIIEEKRKAKEAELDRDIEDWAMSAQEAATWERDQVIKQYEVDKEKSKEELQKILSDIEDYRKKRDVINQEILRSRALEEKQDFYRIQLDENSIRDIQILEEIKPRLSKFDSLDKLIYDIYVKKVADEMIKRVLEGRAPSGIYKITRLKTGEIYIGKSTDVKARWQQHTKSVFHCGTISHSILHTTMERDGIENFTWEFLEEVSKDKLGEREKYWIEFYDSKNYGLNERVG